MTVPPVHHYRTRCTWSGSTGVGYQDYRRDHEASASPAETTLALSSDPTFRGNPARLNPEQLLVMAASSCQLLSFLAVAARARLNVLSYQDDAVGTMPENGQPIRLVSILLRPRIVLAPGTADEARVRELVDLAHRECYIANSLKTEITVDPVIEWQD